MTVNDPKPIRTEVHHTYAAADPTVVHTTEVRDTGAVAAWWIGGIVTIVAIIAVVFMVTRDPADPAALTPNEVAATIDNVRLQGALDSTERALNATEQAARDASQRAAQATSDAANSAERAARSAADSAAAASDRVANEVPPVQ